MNDFRQSSDMALIDCLLTQAQHEDLDVYTLVNPADPVWQEKSDYQHRLEYAFKAVLSRTYNATRILDIHCGGGYTGAALLRHQSQAFYVGLDPDIREGGWSPLAGARDLLYRLYPKAKVKLIRSVGLTQKVLHSLHGPFEVVHLGHREACRQFDKDLRMGCRLLTQPGVLLVSNIDSSPSVRQALLDFSLGRPEWPYYVRAGNGLTFTPIT